LASSNEAKVAEQIFRLRHIKHTICGLCGGGVEAQPFDNIIGSRRPPLPPALHSPHTHLD